MLTSMTSRPELFSSIDLKTFSIALMTQLAQNLNSTLILKASLANDLFFCLATEGTVRGFELPVQPSLFLYWIGLCQSDGMYTDVLLIRE